MNFEVVIDGRAWTIDLEPGDEPDVMQVTVNGRTRLVRVAWIDRDTLSMIAGNEEGLAISHEVGFRRIANGEVEIALGGNTLRASVARVSGTGRRTVAGRGAQVTAPAGNRNIVAPMPGRVVRLLVAEGDRVTAGDGVVVIEAMKMENELRSPSDGIVKRIAVRQDAAIDAGTLLAVIEPCL